MIVQTNNLQGIVVGKTQDLSSGICQTMDNIIRSAKMPIMFVNVFKVFLNHVPVCPVLWFCPPNPATSTPSPKQFTF